MLPGGVYLIGGGTRLNDFVEVAKKSLRLPAAVGANKNIPAVIDKVNETEYLNALGLVIWGSQVAGSAGGGFNFPGGKTVNKTFDKAKKWFKSLIP